MVGLAAVVLLAVAAFGGASGDAAPPPALGRASNAVAPSASSAPASTTQPTTPTPTASPPPPPAEPVTLPGGGRKIFGGGRFLVAYYGTAGTGVLGVLGETGPQRMDRRLTAATEPFARPDHLIRKVYELIVTVADGVPGADGDFSHDISREKVQQYMDAAHRNGALLLLDLQPGRSGFLDVAKRWEWALRDPWVGLALDPEWRMGRHQVPGRRLGGVQADEINRTSAWLADLTATQHLPEKLFVLHQFRFDMIRGIGSVRARDGLAMVQHVDGFGTPGQKRATYAAVARPARFTMGFKLFYDQDVRRMGAPQVLAIRPKVRFVSFQ